MKPGPLTGLSVLELGRMVAAPFCGKLLADLGADVVKVEQPRLGDPSRHRGPFPDDTPHPERSGLFLYLNTTKRGITLSLEKEAGRQILRELLAQVDVLIEDLAPGELERLGLGNSALSELNPRLIVTSITPFGQSGPYRDYRSYHLNLYHGSGHSSFFYVPEGQEDRAPPKGGGYLGEYDGGLTAAVGTMAAVLSRRSTGSGQHIDVSKQDAMMCLERVDIGRMTNETGLQPWRRMTGGLMRAKDGYFIVTPIQNHQWKGFVRAMGDPEWSRAEWCQNEIGRMEHRDEIQPRVEEWALGVTRDEIYHRAQAEGTPVGPVRTVSEVMASAQAQARTFFTEIEHAEAGTQMYPSAPYQFSETPWAGKPAPLLGEHNDEIYRERLGYTEEDLERLVHEGVI
jgi:crotonobetainyl-CoA:carnitine CoA-transferase CaiB-like acyl-CoA transferase